LKLIQHSAAWPLRGAPSDARSSFFFFLLARSSAAVQLLALRHGALGRWEEEGKSSSQCVFKSVEWILYATAEEATSVASNGKSQEMTTVMHDDARNYFLFPL